MKVKEGKWKESIFHTVKGDWNYQQIFNEMALEIRLTDVDLVSLRYLPGNQWAAPGKKVLYPGYLTFEAFAALDTVPPPNTSSACPSLSSHQPSNSLYLVFNTSRNK